MGLTLKDHYQLINNMGIEIIETKIEVKCLADTYNLKQDEAAKNVNNQTP